MSIETLKTKKMDITPRRRAIGQGAGLLSLCLIIFSVAGALWGKLRPAYTGHRIDDNGVVGYAVDSTLEGANIQFASFGWFVMCVSALSVSLGLFSFIRLTSGRGIGGLIWTGIVAAASSAAFYVMGSVTALHLSENAGEIAQWVPDFNPTWGLLAATFLAVLAYWSAALVTTAADWTSIPRKGDATA